jgi:geranylgeranyl pyrophosphate synthase
MAASPKRVPRTALAAGSRDLALRLETFERYLTRAVKQRAGGTGRLAQALRYAALSPGKRLRPLLVLTTCEAVGGEWRRALPAAAAVECVHAFSLVHDDLPAMDDDDYRRGRLTTHKKFGEGLGILAGDALIAFAFEELTRLREEGVPDARVVDAVRRLGYAAGAEQLVGGQALDIAAEGKRVSAAGVRNIHVRKTGALMGASIAIGALAGDADTRTADRLNDAGVMMGFAFQIHDDLLNAGSTLKALGKRVGTDAARGKATFPGAVGEKRARAEATRIMSAVESAIARSCERPALLQLLIGATAKRES